MFHPTFSGLPDQDSASKSELMELISSVNQNLILINTIMTDHTHHGKSTDHNAFIPSTIRAFAFRIAFRTTLHGLLLPNAGPGAGKLSASQRTKDAPSRLTHK